MNKTLRLSLLYLLLIIPQHGNSPIPRMESWMEMDQGDGFVDRDLTSSLTGVESFGSAHKNYQNALIRKKQSNSEDEGMLDEFSEVMSDRIQRKVSAPQNFMNNPNFGYSKYVVGNGQNQAGYGIPENLKNVNLYKDNRYQMKLLNKNDKSSNTKFDDTLRGQRYSNIMSSNGLPSGRRSNRNSLAEGGKMLFGCGSGRMGKCSICGSRRSCDPEEAKMQLLKLHDTYNHGEGLDDVDYLTGNGEPLGLIKNELTENDLKDIQMGEGQDQRFMRYSRYDDDPEVEESEYYGEDRNPAFVRGNSQDNVDVDYSQINPHSIIYKREEKKGQGSDTKLEEKGEEVSGGAINAINGESKLKPSKEPQIETMLRASAPKESHEIPKPDSKGLNENADIMWHVNSGLESKELKDVMRDSQRALEEVQMFQQKLASKPQYSNAHDWKINNYFKNKRNPEEDGRSKREDEDEQKNMKTGTDEGGGEYEDEEGKGHNDEEEYYEDSELSTGKSRVEDGEMYKTLNQKFYKREAGKDVQRKASKGKEEEVEMSSDDYELSLENAPVENEEKSKKSFLREGLAGKKHVARKGAKIWDQWGKWSPCSVTCGVGRMTRWRHCIGGGCAQGEKEAQIKKCTNPAC